MSRAIRWDGLLAYALPGHEWSPALLSEVREWIAERRPLDGFDIVVEGVTPDDAVAAAEVAARWQEEGATWWVESDWEGGTVQAVRLRIAAGPPRKASPG